MRRAFLPVAGLSLVFGLAMPTTPSPGMGEETVDVVILMGESTDGLVSRIRSLGGVVRFQFRNVHAVAATIPATRLGEVARLRRVLKVEKDRMVYLFGGYGNVAPRRFEAKSMEGIEIQALDAGEVDPGALSEGLTEPRYTGALEVWNETGMGHGTVVAVLDTGTARTPCLAHAVVGAPGFPEGYNAVGDGIPATDYRNDWHGTHVGGVIASACALSFSGSTNPVYRAISRYLPWGPGFVPIIGQAPLARIYPVKVFPDNGLGTRTSTILDGLDHVLTLKKQGLLDVDIVHLSCSGPSFSDGRDIVDRFLAALAWNSVLVVTGSGNSGEVPNSTASPATSFASLSVGALDYALSSRILYEYVGLGIWPGTPGVGGIMRPTAETRVPNFSGRGPTSDGRAGVDLAAQGMWNLHVGPGEIPGQPGRTDVLRWASSTAFASASVVGGAALLNAYWEDRGRETSPIALRNVLLRGADPDVVGSSWQDSNTQGWGALDIPHAFDLLKRSPWRMARILRTGTLEANILPAPLSGAVDSFESGLVTVAPSESYDMVFGIGESTSKVTIQVFDIDTPDNGTYAILNNALVVHLQSAKRTAWTHPVRKLWFPYAHSFDFVIRVEDGPWTMVVPWTDNLAYQPMEPGLMKFSLGAQYANEDPVSFRVRITRENLRSPRPPPVASGRLWRSQTTVVPVVIPEGVSRATFDLDWKRKWDRFPTNDLDMLVYDPTSRLVSQAGATANAPERAVLEEPVAGTWKVVINAYEVTRSDLFDLYLRLE